MAQKINPLAFRGLKNYEKSFYQQHIYKDYCYPYVLEEQRKVKFFIERFFKNTNLILHSFKFVKTPQGIAQLSLRYVYVPSRNYEDFMETGQYSTFEKAFLFGFSKIIANSPVTVSFFNLDKGRDFSSIPASIKGSSLKLIEIASYLHVLTSVKGSSFFLANIISSKLQKMRSRSERKAQARFLIFVTNLLLHVYEHNSIGIKGIKVGIKGRINGVPRSKIWETGQGKMSLQRIDADIDYSYLPSDTVYGTFGIKVWINYESSLEC